MKSNNILLSVLLIVLAWACTPDKDNNKGLDFEEIEVNFSATSNAVSFASMDEIGILAYCTTGGGIENSVMKQGHASSAISKWVPLSDGSQVMLKKATGQDAVVARNGDHNFRFYGIYPYIEGDFDITSIPMSVPEVQTFNGRTAPKMTLVASKSSSNVVPTQELEFKSFFAVLNLRIARDIIEENVPAVLKSVTLTPVNAALLEDPLAVEGVCDAEKMTFVPTPGTGKNSVTIDFGTDGYALEEEFTVVPMIVNPFYVPEGGFELTVTDVNGQQNVVEIFAESSDNGKSIAGGEIVEVIVDAISDGIVPVEWPVVFPVGYAEDKTSWCDATRQPRWLMPGVTRPRGEGYWACEKQPQAWAQWYWGEGNENIKTPVGNLPPYLERVTNAGLFLSTLGVKGAWTNDCLQFTIPVKKFKAGSRVKFSIPVLCKNSPIFWEVKYLDGEEWKTTATENLPAYDGSDVTRKATWSFQFSDARAGGARKYETIMTFENAVPSGYITIRMECVDGTVVMTADKTVQTVEMPMLASAKNNWNTNFYFTEHQGTTCIESSVSFELL